MRLVERPKNAVYIARENTRHYLVQRDRLIGSLGKFNVPLGTLAPWFIHVHKIPRFRGPA